ncbi:MAG: 5-oxoprolinase subunit PxpA [Verrucomicrobiota bacterium]
MGGLIINCDLGENESDAQTGELLAEVDAANICCGVHAGSPEKTAFTIQLAEKMGVKIGAHPGLSQAAGRGSVDIDAGGFGELLEIQVGGFFQLATSLGVSVHHLKLHGALYHVVEKDPALRASLFDWMASRPDLVLFCLAGGACQHTAETMGRSVMGEIFADRAYNKNGSLVPRSEVGALIEDADHAVDRFMHWQQSGEMPCLDGAQISLRAQTVCVHSDSPNSLQLLKRLKSAAR